MIVQSVHLINILSNDFFRKSDEFDDLFEKLKRDDLGYKKKESDGKKEIKIHDETGKLIVTSKIGTFIDAYHDDQTMKVRFALFLFIRSIYRLPKFSIRRFYLLSLHKV